MTLNSHKAKPLEQKLLSEKGNSANPIPLPAPASPQPQHHQSIAKPARGSSPYGDKEMDSV